MTSGAVFSNTRVEGSGKLWMRCAKLLPVAGSPGWDRELGMDHKNAFLYPLPFTQIISLSVSWHLRMCQEPLEATTRKPTKITGGLHNKDRWSGGRAPWGVHAGHQDCNEKRLEHSLYLCLHKLRVQYNFWELDARSHFSFPLLFHLFWGWFNVKFVASVLCWCLCICCSCENRSHTQVVLFVPAAHQDEFVFSAETDVVFQEMSLHSIKFRRTPICLRFLCCSRFQIRNPSIQKNKQWYIFFSFLFLTKIYKLRQFNKAHTKVPVFLQSLKAST